MKNYKIKIVYLCKKTEGHFYLIFNIKKLDLYI